MRLVAAPDSAIGSADRALWLTVPFDLALTTPGIAGPYFVTATQVFMPGATTADMYLSGASGTEVFLPGAMETEVEPQ